jgi:hypothetical protein
MPKKITRTPRRWSNDTYIVDGAIVGTTTKDAFGRGWWAHGCLSEWQDTDLGLCDSESKARHKVEQWVKDNE